MITTCLKIEFSEALPSGLSCMMVKTVEMPYALRPGDQLCDGDPGADEAIDLTIAGGWYELENSTLVATCEGVHEMQPGTLEPLRQALFGLGWQQELKMPS